MKTLSVPRKLKSVIAAMLGAALLCAACTAVQLSDEASSPLPLADFPIELRHRLPTVDVTVSGQSLKLFLDLGGFHAISLTTAEIDRTKVRFREKTHRFMNSAGTAFESRQFIAPNVVIAGVEFGDLQGGEFVFDGTNAPPEGNGYIGMGLLRKFLVVLDYPARRVRLYRTGDTRAFTVECGRNTFEVLLVDQMAQSNIKTDHGDLRFQWDTGATHNFVRPSVIRNGEGYDRTDTRRPATITIGSLRIGAQELGPQEFQLASFNAPAPDGVLGTSLFASRKVCLDLPEGKGAIP